MQFKTLVRVEHLNHHKFLFGGYMLQWVDEYVYIAATQDFPQAHFVTRAMDAVSFTQGVLLGSVLTFDITQVKRGMTSVTYAVDVTAMTFPSGEVRNVFNTHVTMCNIDETGHKQPLPIQCVHNA